MARAGGQCGAPGFAHPFTHFASHSAPWMSGNSSQDTGAFQILYFFLISFALLILWRLACLFGSPGSSASIQKCSVGVAPHADIFLIYLWGGQ